MKRWLVVVIFVLTGCHVGDYSEGTAMYTCTSDHWQLLNHEVTLHEQKLTTGNGTLHFTGEGEPRGVSYLVHMRVGELDHTTNAGNSYPMLGAVTGAPYLVEGKPMRLADIGALRGAVVWEDADGVHEEILQCDEQA